MTFSAALQDGIISPDEVFTVPNTLTIDGWVFHDAENHPTEKLTATQILAQSSNIGTIEIAQQLGEGRLAAQIATLGFGRGTGLGFPAESAGLVKSDPATWRVSDIGSTPIGQDDAVTAQQVLDMVNTVGTGGVFVPPRLVRATVAPDGSVTRTRAEATHRALSQEVASQLTTMMEQVVQDGTAVTAGVPGYTVAGKTGTAQIPDPVHGGYIPGAYEATFAGFAPAENPALSAIVVLERPSPIYGGIVAAPVFSQIMRYALHRYGIPTSPGGGTTGGTPLSVPFPQLPPPKSTTADTPGPTTTTTTIVRFPWEAHGKGVTAPGGPPSCAWTACSRRSRSSRCSGTPPPPRSPPSHSTADASSPGRCSVVSPVHSTTVTPMPPTPSHAGRGACSSSVPWPWT